ncbi:uncharacterized protein FFNC_09415 [Fusarium fujikuroi]|nr:uncharacterized protein FFNC_09415 [Fusarium fujikuroi]
MTPYLLRRPRN